MLEEPVRMRYSLLRSNKISIFVTRTFRGRFRGRRGRWGQSKYFQFVEGNHLFNLTYSNPLWLNKCFPVSNISKNIQNFFLKYSKLFSKIFKNISTNIQKYFNKCSKVFPKIFKNVFKKYSKIIPKDIQKYSQKYFQLDI